MTIFYDTVLKRPGCVLLQAAVGATVLRFSRLFPAETWLTTPTPNMRLYEITEEQLSQLVQITADANDQRDQHDQCDKKKRKRV